MPASTTHSVADGAGLRSVPTGSRRSSALRTWRLPSDVRSWRATLLVVLLVSAPPLATFWLAPSATTLAHQADIVGLFIYPVMLSASLHVYFHWRLVDDVASARLTVVLFAAAVHGLSRVALRIGYADELETRVAQRVLVDVLFTLVVLSVLTLRPRRDFHLDPAGVGITIGLLFGSLRFAAVHDPRTLDPGPVGSALLHLVLLALQLMVAAAVLQLRPLPGWVRLRLAVAFALLTINHVITFPFTDESWVAGVAIATDLAGAALLVGTTMALLRRSTRRRRLEIDDLHDRIDEAELDHRDDRERLHEIGATVAGIACASRLMSEPGQIPRHRADQLQQMVGSEIARLERLMQQRTHTMTDVDLDEAIRPLVVAHHARGEEADWSPTGLTAHGRLDDIAEVVHILLDNAARHASGAPVSITGTQVDNVIEVRVEDKGPGIPDEVAPRIFEHGEHGQDSDGQGIGLHVAARLMEDMGGSVRLSPTAQGTTFVLRMPKARSSHVPPSAQAQ